MSATDPPEATTAATAPPATSPSHGFTPWETKRYDEVYAPMPKNAAWPKENIPA